MWTIGDCAVNCKDSYSLPCIDESPGSTRLGIDSRRACLGLQAQTKKGWCPKLDNPWVRPCLILEWLGAVVYRVQMPPLGVAP